METSAEEGGFPTQGKGPSPTPEPHSLQTEAVLRALDERVTGLQRSLAATEARLDLMQAMIASPSVLRATFERQRKQPAAQAASTMIEALCCMESPTERARILYDFASSKLKEQADLKLFLAAEIRRRPGCDARLLAVASLLDMQAYRQKSAYSLVHRIYVDEVAVEVQDDLHTSVQQQDAAVMAAHALVRMGRLEEALRFIDEQLEARPRFRTLEEYKARILAVTHPEQATVMLKRIVIRRGRGSLSAVLLLGELLSRKGSFRLARQMLDERHAAAPNKDLKIGLANRAAHRGDWLGQAKYLAEFFGAQGLWTPRMPDPGMPFDLKGIAPHALPAVDDGPLVTVVMTAFNSEAHIESAIRSVLDQTYRNLELFVVDDVSSDRTREIMVRLAAEDGRVRPLFRSRNAGTYVAKNEAIAQSSGEFVTCHDSDDWWHPQHLELHVAKMVGQPDLVATKSGWVRVNEDGMFMLKPWGSYSHQNPASAMFRRFVIDEIGYFDSVRTGADTEYWHRTMSHYGTSRVAYLPRTLTIGLHHDSSLTTSGAAGFDAYGVNLTRLAYCESWACWQAEQIRNGTSLKMEFPLERRRFAAPTEIRSGDALDPEAAPGRVA